MSVDKTQIENLFSVNDIITCHRHTSLSVTAILDQHIQLKSDVAGDEAISITYTALAEALKSSPDTATPHAPLDCFVTEYRVRAEQARRDEEVDAMWKSAMTCQL